MPPDVSSLAAKY